MLPIDRDSYSLKTNLTPAQVGESFATPETVPFWQLLLYRGCRQRRPAAAGYRLQYYQPRAALLSGRHGAARRRGELALLPLRRRRRPVLGSRRRISLYVLAKITGDLSKAGLMPPLAAAGLPALVGGLTGLTALLYQEDG